MAKHHKLELTESEIQALVDLRDKGEPAYLRERATLLKIHQGFSPHEVARRGLLKPRDPDTVYAWLRRYREHGISGLSNKPGRGRKPEVWKPSEVFDRSASGTRQSAPNARCGTLRMSVSRGFIKSCHGLFAPEMCGVRVSSKF